MLDYKRVYNVGVEHSEFDLSQGTPRFRIAKARSPNSWNGRWSDFTTSSLSAIDGQTQKVEVTVEALQIAAFV